MTADKVRESFPLLFAEENRTFIISELMGGQEFRTRCINQGLIPGQKIEMIRNSGCGACIIGINNGRIMMGRNMLHRIMVSQC